MLTKLPGGRDDKEEESTAGKEREKTSAENHSPQPTPPHPHHPRAFTGFSLPWPLAGGGGWRTSQEGVAEEDQATETKISKKVWQGNPVWVQLCPHLTAQ